MLIQFESPSHQSVVRLSVHLSDNSFICLSIHPFYIASPFIRLSIRPVTSPFGSFVYPFIHFRSPHLSFHPSTPRLGHLSLRLSISRCLTSICPSIHPSIHFTSRSFVTPAIYLTSPHNHLSHHASTHFRTHSFVWPSIHFTSPHTHLSGHPSIHFICQAIHPLTSRLIHLSGHLSISRHLTPICLAIHSFHDSFICLAIHPLTSRLIHLSGHPSIHRSVRCALYCPCGMSCKTWSKCGVCGVLVVPRTVYLM